MTSTFAWVMYLLLTLDKKIVNIKSFPFKNFSAASIYNMSFLVSEKLEIQRY